MTVNPVTIYDKESSLNSIPIDSQVITSYLLNLFRYKFADPRNHYQDTLRTTEYVWRPDDMTIPVQTKTKGILIDAVHKYDPTDSQQRPAIIVAREQQELGPRMSIGDRYQTPTNFVGDVNQNLEATLGFNQHVFAMAGAHSIYAIHREGAACEILGIELWEYLIMYSHVIRQDIGFDEFRVAPLPKIGKLDEFQENWVIPIMVTYKYQKSVIMKEESPLLKRIEISPRTTG